MTFGVLDSVWYINYVIKGVSRVFGRLGVSMHSQPFPSLVSSSVQHIRYPPMVSKGLILTPYTSFVPANLGTNKYAYQALQKRYQETNTGL